MILRSESLYVAFASASCSKSTSTRLACTKGRATRRSLPPARVG